MRRRVAVVSGTVLMYEPGQGKGWFNDLAKKSMGIFDYAGEDKVARHLCDPWCVRYKSPFDSNRQVRVELPSKSFPEPVSLGPDDEDEGPWRAWLEAVGADVTGLLRQEGVERILVLLGAYKDINGLAEIMRQTGEFGPGELLYASPNKSAQNLVAQFDKGVIIGSRQFWTGVDIPDLDYVVVAKLPYPPLGDPKWKQVDFKTGRKKDLRAPYLWQTVLTFRQGCGRLIRSTESVGTIRILDRRIYNKRNSLGITHKAWQSWAKGNTAWNWHI